MDGTRPMATSDQTLPDPSSGAKITSAWFNTVADLLNGWQAGVTETGVDTADDTDTGYIEIYFPRPYKALDDPTGLGSHPSTICTAERVGQQTSHTLTLTHWLNDTQDGTFVGFAVRAWQDGNVNKLHPIRVHWTTFGVLA